MIGKANIICLFKGSNKDNEQKEILIEQASNICPPSKIYIVSLLD